MSYYDGYGTDVAGQMASRVTGFVLGKIIWAVYACFIYFPLVWFSVLLVDNLEQVHHNELYSRLGFIVMLAYLFYCVMYFIKGIIIAFKVNHRILWIPLWIIAVLFTCGFHAFLIQNTLERSLNPPTGTVVENYVFWSWIGALMMGLLIYRYYEFGKDSAPRIAFWAYSLGFNASLQFVKQPLDSRPNRSNRYL
jgi:hypothetical protein